MLYRMFTKSIRSSLKLANSATDKVFRKQDDCVRWLPITLLYTVDHHHQMDEVSRFGHFQSRVSGFSIWLLWSDKPLGTHLGQWHFCTFHNLCYSISHSCWGRFLILYPVYISLSWVSLSLSLSLCMCYSIEQTPTCAISFSIYVCFYQNHSVTLSMV